MLGSYSTERFLRDSEIGRNVSEVDSLCDFRIAS